MVTLIVVALVGFLAVRLVLSVVGKARSTSAKMKANSHWLWLTGAVVVALLLASRR